jgi:hypothetical protein
MKKIRWEGSIQSSFINMIMDRPVSKPQYWKRRIFLHFLDFSYVFYFQSMKKHTHFFFTHAFIAILIKNNTQIDNFYIYSLLLRHFYLFLDFAYDKFYKSMKKHTHFFFTYAFIGFLLKKHTQMDSFYN